MYSLLLVIHILSAMAWIGVGLSSQLMIQHANSSGGSAVADRQMAAMEWMQKAIYIPAPILVLLTGVTMVATSDAWSFAHLWVTLALSFIILAIILGGAIGGRFESKIASLREDGRVESAEYGNVLSKLLNVGWVELVVLVTIVILMVYKPGA